MKVNVIGQVQQIGAVQVIGEKEFKKQEVIVKTIEERPQFYKVEFTGDNLELVDKLEEDSNVNITCGLNGREYTNKDTGNYNVFMSLRAWALEKV